MATQKENLKKLFSDTRSRNVVIITGFLLVIMVVVGLIALRDRLGSAGVTGTTKVSGRGAARVRSIPGALKPSDEYVKLVQKANIEAAEKAKQQGKSAIPTIVKAQELSEGNIPGMPKGAVGGVPFSALARGGTPTRGIWFNNLVRSNCGAEALAEAKQLGASIADLKAAGCTVKKLLAAGYTLAQLKEGGFSASELRAAGFTAAQLRAAGFSAADLRNAGFSACEVKAAGYTAEEMRAAGYTDGELRGAGFTAEEIAGSTGLPPGMTEEQLTKLSCEKDGVLAARQQGVTAKKMRSFLGADAKKLSAAGYAWDQLQQAGFSALELLQSGANCSQLSQAGFSAQDLVESGQCANELSGIGVAPTDIDAAKQAINLPGGLTLESISQSGCANELVSKYRTVGLSAGQIRRSVNCPVTVLKEVGYSPRQLRNAGYTARQLADAGVSANDLRAAGYTDGQARAASLLPGCITADELQRAGCDPESLSNLRRRGVSAQHIKEYIGCSAEALLRSGFSSAELKNAGYSAAELSKAGQSCSQLRQAGASAAELLESGVCSESELLAAGFSAEEIAAAKEAKLSGGYTAGQLRSVKGLPSALREAREKGVKLSELRRLGGFQPRDLRAAGYTAAEMRAAGFTPRELLKAGFTEAELRAAGLSADEIARARNLPGGLTVRDIRAGCCTVDSIAKARKAGADAHAIRDIGGCSARSLRNGGFGAEDLIDAGFTTRELQASGFDCSQLVRGGASAALVMESKVCMANDLLDYGYTPVQISAAQNALQLPGGYTTDKLIKTGCIVESVRDGRKAGLTAHHYRRIIGCSANTMRLAGYDITELQKAGYTARDVLNGGFSESDALRAGYSQMQLDTANDTACVACSSQSSLKSGGCSKLALQDARTAGISAGDVKDIINCSAADLIRAGYGATELKSAGYVAKDLKDAGLSCDQLKESGVTASDLLNGGACSKAELQAAGFDAKQIDRAEVGKLSSGYDYAKLISGGCKSGLSAARDNGVNAGEIRRVLGCPAKDLRTAGFSGGELKQSGYSARQLKEAGFDAKDLRIAGFSAKTLRNACFTVSELKAAGFTAADLAKAGFSAKELMAAGFTAEQLREAGFSAKELLDAGFTPQQLIEAGYTTKDLMEAGLTARDLAKAGLSPETLDADALKAAGITAADMKKAGYSCLQLKDMGYTAGDLKQAGCSVQELLAAGFSIKDLKEAGFTAKELKDAGVSAKDLLTAFSAQELKDAGFTAEELLAAGLKPRDLLNAGFSVKDLKDAGLSAEELRKAGLTAAELLSGGFTEDEIRKAGYTTAQLGDAGILPLTGLPGQLGGGTPADRANQQLEEVYRRQTAQIDAQKFQQQIQKRLTKMQGEAVKIIAGWKSPVTQQYAAGNPPEKDKDGEKEGSAAASNNSDSAPEIKDERGNVIHRVKAGDIIYAILDTTINSDESAPILATITHGPLKGGKLIGTMTKPPNAKSVLVTFNTLSLKQLDHSIPLTAYAIDQNTARSALASRVDNHFLLKYGSIIATSFLDGFGQAFLQQGTSIATAAGGATTTVTVGSRTASEAALIGLGKLGQKLGQAVTPLQNKPPTVYVFSGTPIGVFFTADMEIR